MPQSRLNIYLAGLCAAVLAAKFFLLWRVNVNWDEFFYLSHVFTLARGESVRILQQGYVHAFAWLADFGNNEMDQVLAARVVMWGLLAATTVLIAKLASRWVTPAIVWFAPLTFFAVASVLKHSASFRSDSLLAFLTLVALVALTSSRSGRRPYVIAGCAVGVSIVVSLKACLFLPLYILVAATNRSDAGVAGTTWLRVAMTRCIWLGAAAGASAGTILLLHWLAMPSVDSGATQGFAMSAARKVLLDVPLFPRWDYLRASLAEDWLSWLLITGGLGAALVSRKRAALCALSLLPLVFYRNAFPYYYVVMLAPASVLAAVAVQAALDASSGHAPHQPATSRQALIAIVISLPLILQTALQVAELGYDRQVAQRRTIDSVHHIFHEPVPYIDHSGMIASFPKANFFMSSWGVENYRERGTSFMAEAIATLQPPLLVANTPVLMPSAGQSAVLLEEDRKLIESSYVPYWGIIMVAGTEAVVPPNSTLTTTVPFTGPYRLETEMPLKVNGEKRHGGEVVVVDADKTGLELTLHNESSDVLNVRFVWADANPELPNDFPPLLPVYSPL